jgi:SHS2 domain-containing protein
VTATERAAWWCNEVICGDTAITKTIKKNILHPSSVEPSYTYLEHTADVLFQAEAPTLEALFEQCGLAVENAQVHIQNVEAKEKRIMTGESKNIESLLFDFLNDLLFYKDAEQLIFSRFDVRIEEKDGIYHLTCTAYGEKLDVEKHDPKVDVKAITMHEFEVKKTTDGWTARVLIDV